MIRLRVLRWVAAFCVCAAARAAVYQVGPSRQYKTLQAVSALLKPGDAVNIDGGVTYPGGVTLAAGGGAGDGVISVKGIRVNGLRPVLSGVPAQGGAVLRVLGSHYLVEGFDLTTGGDPRASRCFYNAGDDVTLRDSVVHDCHCTGIAGADASGSLTLDQVEVFRCGQGLFAHQIYVGSSLARYPDALFTMRNCYVHDGAGGNNVKSRVTRNRIEYNWIEGAMYHELDLVGPDPKAQPLPRAGWHCDAAIVGNVFIETESSLGAVARFGSDGTASSRGRYIFASNTVIVRSPAAARFGLLWLKGEIDSIALWNNVFWSDAGPLDLVRQEAAPPGPALEGEGNWLPQSARNVPPAWRAIRGADPEFADASAGDFRPVSGSPLIGAGCIPPRPEALAAEIPPRQKTAAGGPRPAASEKDIGAWPGQAGTH